MTLQITENQSGYLAVEHRDENNKLFAFFGVLAVIIGLVFGGWALHRATYSEQLTCEGQDAARCTVRRESLLRTSDSSVPVRQIASAQFDEETDPPRLRLLTENDNLELRLTGAEEGCTGCGPGTTKYGPAQQVEMFLDDSGTDRLVIRSDYRPGWSSLLVLAVVFFAVGGVLLWQIVTSHIELTPQWLVVGRNRLVGGSRSEYRTEAIQSVEVERSEVTDRGHNQKRYVYRVVVEMEDGESVPLTARWCSGKEDVEQIRDEIARTAKLKDGN